MLLPLFLLLLQFSQILASYASCFDRYSRRTIANSEPIAKYEMVALSTCMQHCLQSVIAPCFSFTYDTDFHICRLYDHDGYKVPAIVHPALTFDYFARKISAPNCQVAQSADGNPNFAHLRKGFKEQAAKSVLSQPLRKSLNDITNFRTHDAAERKDEFSRRMAGVAMRESEPIASLDSEVTFPPSKPKVVAESPKPETKGQLGYYVVLGTEIEKGEDTEGLVQVLDHVDQGDCARLCSANVGTEQSYFDCKSLNYYPATRKCELYSIQVEPNGSGKFLANQNTIYSEKFVIPMSARICQDDEVFILHVQKTVSRTPLASEDATGITPCLAKCLEHSRCQSAVYNDDKNACMLFEANVGANPDALKDTAPGSVAIENPCVNPRARAAKTRIVSEDSSSEWSGCSFKVDGKTVRVRETPSGLDVKPC